MTSPTPPARTGVSRVYGLRLLAQPGVQRTALLLVLGLVLVVRLVQFMTWTSQIQWGYDFSAYWQAAGRVLDGAAVYTAEQLAGPYSPQQQYLYLYPPFFAVVMTPFAAIFDDYRVANWLWAAIGAALLIGSVLAIARREGILAGRERWLLVGGALAFPPVVAELVLGNVHLLVLGLLASAWLALSGRGSHGRRPELVAGALVGVAALIKVFPLVIVLWFIVRGRWVAAVTSVAVMVVLAAATVPIVGLEAWLDYPQVLANLGAPTDTTDTIAPAVWLATVLPSPMARVLVGVVGVVVVAWAARRRPEAVSYAIAVVVSVLIAPALYQHYLAIFVLPLLLAIRHAPPLWWVAIAYVLMFGGEQESLGGVVWVVNRVLPTLGALFLLAGLAVWGDARRRAAGPASAG